MMMKYVQEFLAHLGEFGSSKNRNHGYSTAYFNKHPKLDDVRSFFPLFRYLPPEYAENGIVSVRTDVYSFGIVLIQLISGRKAVDLSREGNWPSLRQWVCVSSLYNISRNIDRSKSKKLKFYSVQFKIKIYNFNFRIKKLNINYLNLFKLSIYLFDKYKNYYFDLIFFSYLVNSIFLKLNPTI